MKHQRIYNTAITFLATFTLLVSCQKSVKNDLAEAQQCLNTAATTDARNCVSKISSDTTAQAYGLRCASIFISEGFGSPASLMNSLNSMNSSGSCTGGCSSTVNALFAFNFTSGSVSSSSGRQTNIDNAQEAFNECSKAEVDIYTQISSLFNIGTRAAMTAYGLTGGAAITQDNLESALASLASSDSSTVGAIATTTYSSTCSDTTNAASSTQQYCTELAAAINSGSSNEAIGSCLLNKMQNPSYTCP